MNTFRTQKQQGFSLVELMVSTLIAIIMSFAVIQLFLSQNNQIRQDSHRDLTEIETQALFETLARLIRQAQTSTVDIKAPLQINNNHIERNNDSLDVRFRLLDNYRIWPNDNADNNGNFSKSEIRLYWQNNSQLSVNNQTLYIAWSEPGNIEQAPLQAMNNETAPIINLDIWPLRADQTPADSKNDPATGGLLLSIISRSPGSDPAYTNPNDPDGSYRNVRTHTISSIISPRN